jgi:hypothetical protein
MFCERLLHRCILTRNIIHHIKLDGLWFFREGDIMKPGHELNKNIYLELII